MFWRRRKDLDDLFLAQLAIYGRERGMMKRYACAVDRHSGGAWFGAAAGSLLRGLINTADAA